MRRLISFSLTLFLFTTAYSQSTIPSWFLASVHHLKLDQKYELSAYLKPTFLEADFNGDGVIDVAALITERKTKKKGVLLIHQNSDRYFLFGAGTNFGNGSDDFKWARGWQIYKNKVAYETKFNSDGDILGGKKINLYKKAFYIYDMEDGEPNSGGIIYWTGRKYLWIHQGE